MGLPRAMYSMILIIVEMSFISQGLSGFTQTSAVERISSSCWSGILPVKFTVSSRPLSLYHPAQIGKCGPAADACKMNVAPPHVS